MFRKYDYGEELNPSHYNGSLQPPNYDLSQITVPLHLFYGDSDKFVAEEDLEMLVKGLAPGVVKLQEKVPYSGWQHNDFVYGVDAPLLVYNHIMSILNSEATTAAP